jgi:RNA recognition motif-containing protein
MPATPTTPTVFGMGDVPLNSSTPQPCRTVYIGNIPNDVHASAILDKVRCGTIEAYRSLPEKNCAFVAFLDAREAAIFHKEATQAVAARRFTVNGQELKVSWGKPSPVPQHVVREVQEHNATRNVFVGDVDPTADTEDRIRARLEKYGAIDNVRIMPEKRIAFIHLCSISDAIKAVRELSHDREWQGRRINYGRDRCAPVGSAVSLAARHKSETMESLGLPRAESPHAVAQPQPQVDTNVLIQRLAAVALKAGLHPQHALLVAAAATNTNNGPSSEPSTPGPPSRPRSMSARFQDDLRLNLDSPVHRNSSPYLDALQAPPTPLSASLYGSMDSPASVAAGEAAQNRTVYLGNLHPETTMEELCNVIRGGGLENIKIFVDRGIAFVTFLEADAATHFLARSQREGMTVRHRKLKAGWGRPAPPIAPSVRDAVLYSGASRNVYIGGLPDPDNSPANDPWTVESIRTDFEIFGEIEMVNRPSGMDCAFVNFTKIQSAIKAVEEMNNATDGIPKRYDGLRVNYGKDRCANPPRPGKSIGAPPSPMRAAFDHSATPPPAVFSPTAIHPASALHSPFVRDSPRLTVENSSPIPIPHLPSLAPPTQAHSHGSAPITPRENTPVFGSVPNGLAEPSRQRYQVPQIRRLRASTTGTWENSSNGSGGSSNSSSNNVSPTHQTVGLGWM